MKNGYPPISSYIDTSVNESFNAKTQTPSQTSKLETDNFSFSGGSSVQSSQTSHNNSSVSKPEGGGGKTESDKVVYIENISFAKHRGI